MSFRRQVLAGNDFSTESRRQAKRIHSDAERVQETRRAASGRTQVRMPESCPFGADGWRVRNWGEGEESPPRTQALVLFCGGLYSSRDWQCS